MDNDRQNEIKQEKLANDNHSEAVEGAYYRYIYIHGVGHHHVPGLTSDHLKDCEKSTAHVIEICDTIVDIGSLVYPVRTSLDLKLLV